jgi:uncharacterized protein (TIGR03437 family)
MYKLAALALLASAAAGPLLAVEDRIAASVDSARRVTLRGRVHPQAQPQYDRGPVDQSMPLRYASMLLKPASSLERLLEDLQSPSSPDYHRWLTPEQFGERFGLSGNDRSKVAAWLRSQGLAVHDFARGGLWVTFSGTAQQVGRAFRTEFHRYQVAGESHFANSTDPSVPEALEAVVAGFNGFDDFAPRSMIVPADAEPLFNNGATHQLGPDDFATIYNLGPLYNQGIDGSGVRVAIVGRTAVDLNDIRTFRTKFNLPAKDPEIMLYGPDPGKLSGNELLEANLDLQWAGAVARNATIVFVYAGSVNTAVQYAVDQKAGQVMSMSFGQCEQFGGLAMRAIAQQANAQGMTFLVSSGDGGAATCDWQYSPTPQASKGATVSFPASLPEVTAVGGTEFSDAASSRYWAATNNANGGSALSYIPEITWNQSAARNALVGGGGGASAIFQKPFWQTGPGVPDDHARDLPDISLSASTHDAYYVVSNGAATAVGGTSASSPAFAGIVALLNQYLVRTNVIAQPGLGNINPVLYRMAQSSPDAFHDVVDGDIMVPCAQGTPGCAGGLVGFAAGPRYDLATGLGSVDASRLATAWDNGTPSATTLTADPATASLTDTVRLTASVNSPRGSGVPTGTVLFLANDTVIATGALANAGDHATVTATATGNQIAAGNNSVTAFYTGDAAFGQSSATAPIAFNFPSTAAVVIASVNPNPVVQNGLAWPYTLTLVEKAGVAATITGFSVDGSAQSISLFPTSRLAANGSLSVNLQSTGLTAPIDRAFHLNGTDDPNGNTWSQDFTVRYVAASGPVLAPGISLTATPANVSRSAQADALCQWSQQIVVQEKGGFLTRLSSLRFGATDFTPKIQDLFGTTRLAPYGTLRATVCFDSSTAAGTRSYTISGVSENGSTVSATLSATLSAPAATTATVKPSVSPGTVTIPLAAGGQSGSATLDLLFDGGAPEWTATVVPGSPGGNWLKVSPASGSGATQLQLQASGEGLSKGVYFVTIAIHTPAASPQTIDVPVALVVGASATTSIGGVAHAASFKTVFAPGMLLSVFGTRLAASTAQAARLPLPLTMGGVSATVNGITAPLHDISPGQLNVQVPYETSAGAAVLGINNNGEIASFHFEVAPVAPGIFASSGALVPFSSGKAGDTLLAFMTGDGDLTPSIATGATPPATTALALLPKPRPAVTVKVGGVNAPVDFVGEPFGLAGVTQINFRIPADAPVGVQDVVVTVGSVDSPAVKVEVK